MPPDEVYSFKVLLTMRNYLSNANKKGELLSKLFDQYMLLNTQSIVVSASQSTPYYCQKYVSHKVKLTSCKNLGILIHLFTWIIHKTENESTLQTCICEATFLWFYYFPLMVRVHTLVFLRCKYFVIVLLQVY